MNTQKITKLALMIALTISLSLLFIFPIPATKGFVTLCEVGIYTSALLFGPGGGFIVGALSGAGIDLLSGYPEWMIFSFIIHGLQGMVLGAIYQRFSSKKGMILGSLLASGVMISGYAAATALLYGLPAGLASVPGNLFQNGFGLFVTVPLFTALTKINRFSHYNQKEAK